jgi:PAS domain S-box-containing protein
MAASDDGAVRGDQASDLRLHVDSTPGLIHTSRPDGYFDFFNQNWLTFVGRSLEELQGWNWTTFIHPEDVEGIVEKWRACLVSGEPFLHEARVLRADGEYRWMLHHKVAVADGSGQIVKWYDRVSISRIASGRKNTSVEAPKSCKKANFISPKGSGWPTRGTGPSIMPGSPTGLGCSGPQTPGGKKQIQILKLGVINLLGGQNVLAQLMDIDLTVYVSLRRGAE